MRIKVFLLFLSLNSSRQFDSWWHLCIVICKTLKFIHCGFYALGSDSQYYDFKNLPWDFFNYYMVFSLLMLLGIIWISFLIYTPHRKSHFYLSFSVDATRTWLYVSKVILCSILLLLIDDVICFCRFIQ